jgi:transposase
MRGEGAPQCALFSCVSLEERVPRQHPLRKLRLLVDAVLASLDERLSAVYSSRGRPSIPPEFLLRASLIQLLHSVRSERQLVEQIDFNLLFRWFVGLTIDERVWDHSSFTRNRERLFDEGMGRAFFERVVALAEWQNLVSDEHFSVDGTLIQAWASHKSFQPRDPDRRELPSGEGRNAEADFHGERRSNKTHASLTDPNAQLYRKCDAAPAMLCHMAHVPMENRNGLAFDVQTTPASGTAEREAALRMIRRHPKAKSLGADKGYDTAGFVGDCRALGVTPHVAAKVKGSALDARTTYRPCHLQDLAAHPQALRIDLRLAGDRGRLAPDQARRHRQAGRAEPARGGRQPGAHGGPQWLAGCTTYFGTRVPRLRRMAQRNPDLRAETRKSCRNRTLRPVSAPNFAHADG